MLLEEIYMSDLTIPPEFELHELVGDWEAVFTNFIDKKRTIKRKERKKKENNKLEKESTLRVDLVCGFNITCKYIWCAC